LDERSELNVPALIPKIAEENIFRKRHFNN
jgi:hypothetical protein